MDLIDRVSAVTMPVMPKRYRKYQTLNIDDAYEQGWYDLQAMLEKLPSAQPERKKGKWIKGTGENGVTTSLFCSNCGCENPHWHDWKFCPNCGADMREVE